MFGPVILPLDQAVSAVASAERLAQAGVSSDEVRLRTDMHVYAVARDAAGMLSLGHASHSSHASHVSSSGGGGGDYGYPNPVDPNPPVPVFTVPSAPASIAATPGDGAADVSWAPAVSDDGSTITYTVTVHPDETTVTVTDATTVRVDGLLNGTSYSFTVSATNSVGQGPSTVATGTVVPVAPQLKAHLPVIVGKPAARRTLKVEAEGWAAGTTRHYQWQANGRDVVGADRTTFRPTVEMVGERISVVVTGTNRAYAHGATSTSARTVKVARIGAPSISGKSKVGSVLRAHAGKWTVGTKLRFIWLVGGKAVRHSGPALRVRSAYAGKSIAVRVTGKRSGYDTFVVTSSRTSKVRD